MSNWSKSVIYGGIYARSLHAECRSDCDVKKISKYNQLAAAIEKFLEMHRRSWEKSKKSYLFIKNNLVKHVCRKQEIYWPVFIAVILMLFVFASKIAFAGESGTPNNLPLKGKSKLNIITPIKNKNKSKLCATDGKNIIDIKKIAIEDESDERTDLKEDVAGIVGNTPMAAMIDPISERDRTVAAFIVGIAMKESKFGVYSPKIGGRDCYNYWGFKGGGKTVAEGYTCFSSPDEAVEVVGKRIEKMVAKGVRNPAQAIGWKCGSSCAGHNAAGVRKWIADVGVNFYKINS